MSNNHTPGPWKYRWSQKDRVYKIQRSSALIAEVLDVMCDDADARLIAAAPELLEAAKWALGFCSNEFLERMNKIEDAQIRQIYLEQLERIRRPIADAIAKAEGKE